jgi:HTH-type transcriptional regulator, competence development regulator
MIPDPEHGQLAAFGSRLRKARETRGLTLHELARLSAASAPALSLIENGKRDLRLSSLCRIAAALRVSPGDLLEESSHGNNSHPQARSGGYDLAEYR